MGSDLDRVYCEMLFFIILSNNKVIFINILTSRSTHLFEVTNPNKKRLEEASRSVQFRVHEAYTDVYVCLYVCMSSVSASARVGSSPFAVRVLCPGSDMACPQSDGSAWMAWWHRRVAR
jgi:hypothetical protein